MATLVPQEYEIVPADQVRLHPDNPNQGDVGAVAESIEANGFYGALLVQRSTGYVLAGNSRVQAAVAKGLGDVPVIWADVDDDRARRILLADNRTAQLASYDEAALTALLQELAVTDDGLAGTGWDGDDLDDLLANFAPDGDAQPRLDQTNPVTCPECGHEFTPGQAG